MFSPGPSRMMTSYISQFFAPKSSQSIRISPVKIHDVESGVEKRSRTLKHLLKLNHIKHGLWVRNDLSGERNNLNDVPQALISAYLFGADENDLNRLYDVESKLLEPWKDAPGEVTGEDWRDYLGKKEYERAFVDLFEDELVNEGYDWKAVIHKFMFTGNEPLFSSITAGRGHPLVRLGYAFEMSSRDLAMEALALVATCYNDIHKYSDDLSYSQAEPIYRSSSLFSILEKVRTDKRFHGAFATPGEHNLETIFRDHEATLLEHWNAWDIEDPVQQFRDSQRTATSLFIGAMTEKYDLNLSHPLIMSHAIRIILPLIPEKFHIPLVRQWWLFTLAIYIAELRPNIEPGRINEYDVNGRDWNWIAEKAIKGPHSTNSHYVKIIRALKEIDRTWGDSDSFHFKAATRFVDEFDGWDIPGGIVEPI